MCSIITTDDNINIKKLEKYLTKETKHNPDGMSLVLQDKQGILTSLRTFDLNQVMMLLDITDWSRMWLHMRAATQGDINIRNTHGFNTLDGSFVMHNGVLFDRQSVRFNVDSELIVSWYDNYGPELTMELLLNESYANVFIIKNIGDYYVSRTKNGTLFTDGKGNFSTNQVGRINKAVRPGFQSFYLNGFVNEVTDITEILAHADAEYLNHSYSYNNEVDDIINKYQFNDDGTLDGLSHEEFLIKKAELTETWDSVIDKNEFNDDDYKKYLDEGEMLLAEKKKVI